MSRKAVTTRRAENKALTVEEGTGTSAAQTRLTDVGLEALERLASLGLRQTSLAARLGIARKVLEAILKEQPEAGLAFARGRAELEAELVGSLAEKARKGYAPAAMFLLKTVFSYREQGPVDGETDPRVAIQINLPEPKTIENYMKTISGGSDANG